MAKVSRPKAILFDLDNTLVDRAASLKEYAYRFYIDFRHRLKEGEARSILDLIIQTDQGGYGGWDRIQAVLSTQLEWVLPPAQSELEEHRFENYTSSAKGMAGLHQTLHQLQQQGFILGIITNGSRHSQQGKIDLLGIASYMQAVLISEAARVKKPDSRIFERMLAEIQMPAELTWFVGDHPRNDILGATAVGLTPVWRRGFHPWPIQAPEPQYQIDALIDLLALLGNTA